MVRKILRNVSGATIQILNRDIANNTEYDVAPHFWRELSDDDFITTHVTNGTIVVNNGTEDLSTTVALAHLTDGVIKVIEEIPMIPGAGENAPAMVDIAGAIVGLSMDVGDKFYGHRVIDNLVGDYVKFRWYLCCDNSTADRWVQANVYCKTTAGHLEKTMDSYDTAVSVGPTEIPTTPYLIFRTESQIPTTLFANGEDIIFIGVERAVATGKTAPTNPLLVLKYGVEYWKRQS